jgi:hypothetical protein
MNGQFGGRFSAWHDGKLNQVLNLAVWHHQIRGRLGLPGNPQPIGRFLRQNGAIYLPAIVSLKAIGFPHFADGYARAHEIVFGVCGFRQRSPEPLDRCLNEDFNHIVQLPFLHPQRSYPTRGTVSAENDGGANRTGGRTWELIAPAPACSFFDDTCPAGDGKDALLNLMAVG